MKDNIEATGYWHFPAEEENQYAGNLTCTDGKIRLVLLSCTSIPKEQPFTVHGTTTDGKDITLHSCVFSSRTMGFPGIPQMEISARYYFKGDHLTTETLHFNSAILQMSSLNEWVEVSGFESFENTQDTLSVSYRNPDPITFYKTDTIEFTLLFYRSSPLFKPKYNCPIKQDVIILIKSNATFDLDAFLAYASMIKSFLTLAYFSEPQFLSIEFKKDEIKLNFVYAGQDNEYKKNKSHRTDFLFTYKMIEDSFSTVFGKWGELNATIEPVINVLQESFGNRNIIAENKFLNIMQGIETFHRRRRKNEKEERSAYKEKVAEIIGSCPAEYQEWLKGRLHFANEPTLNDRLDELFSVLDDKLKDHLFQNFDQIIIKAKNTRNYFTHYDKSLAKKASKGAELFYLTERLKIFLLVILLKETGIDSERVTEIVTDGSLFLFNHLISGKKGNSK